MTKRILILGSAYPLRGGGIATFNERMAQALQEEGHEVKIVTFKLQYPKFLFPGKTQLSSEAPPANLDIDVEVNSINPFNWLRVGRKYRKFNADLVVIRYWLPFMAPCLGTIARIIKKNKKSRILAITDNVIPHEKKPFDKQLTNYFLKPCDAFVTLSRSVMDDLRKFTTDKPAEFHPHPLYDNFGEPISKVEAQQKINLDPNYKYLLCFGFIREYKGLDITLKAFADERLRKYPVKLIIAGEYYEDKAKYDKIIDDLGIREHIVERNDFIPNTEVVNYFCASDMVVQTYKHATQSGVTQIAYHFNKPMLVTNVGGLHEFVPHNKVGYVTEKDPKEIADCLIDYFENNREAEFIKGIEEEKQKYTWSSFISSLLKLA